MVTRQYNSGQAQAGRRAPADEKVFADEEPPTGVGSRASTRYMLQLVLHGTYCRHPLCTIVPEFRPEPLLYLLVETPGPGPVPA